MVKSSSRPLFRTAPPSKPMRSHQFNDLDSVPHDNCCDESNIDCSSHVEASSTESHNKSNSNISATTNKTNTTTPPRNWRQCALPHRPPTSTISVQHEVHGDDTNESKTFVSINPQRIQNIRTSETGGVPKVSKTSPEILGLTIPSSESIKQGENEELLHSARCLQKKNVPSKLSKRPENTINETTVTEALIKTKETPVHESTKAANKNRAPSQAAGVRYHPPDQSSCSHYKKMVSVNQAASGLPKTCSTSSPFGVNIPTPSTTRTMSLCPLSYPCPEKTLHQTGAQTCSNMTPSTRNVENFNALAIPNNCERSKRITSQSTPPSSNSPNFFNFESLSPKQAIIWDEHDRSQRQLDLRQRIEQDQTVCNEGDGLGLYYLDCDKDGEKNSLNNVAEHEARIITSGVDAAEIVMDKVNFIDQEDQNLSLVDENTFILDNNRNTFMTMNVDYDGADSLQQGNELSRLKQDQEQVDKGELDEGVLEKCSSDTCGGGATQSQSSSEASSLPASDISFESIRQDTPRYSCDVEFDGYQDETEKNHFVKRYPTRISPKIKSYEQTNNGSNCKLSEQSAHETSLYDSSFNYDGGGLARSPCRKLQAISGTADIKFSCYARSSIIDNVVRKKAWQQQQPHHWNQYVSQLNKISTTEDDPDVNDNTSLLSNTPSGLLPCVTMSDQSTIVSSPGLPLANPTSPHLSNHSLGTHTSPNHHQRHHGQNNDNITQGRRRTQDYRQKPLQVPVKTDKLQSNGSIPDNIEPTKLRETGDTTYNLNDGPVISGAGQTILTPSTVFKKLPSPNNSNVPPLPITKSASSQMQPIPVDCQSTNLLLTTSNNKEVSYPRLELRSVERQVGRIQNQTKRDSEDEARHETTHWVTHLRGDYTDLDQADTYNDWDNCDNRGEPYEVLNQSQGTLLHKAKEEADSLKLEVATLRNQLEETKQSSVMEVDSLVSENKAPREKIDAMIISDIHNGDCVRSLINNGNFLSKSCQDSPFHLDVMSNLDQMAKASRELELEWSAKLDATETKLAQLCHKTEILETLRGLQSDEAVVAKKQADEWKQYATDCERRLEECQGELTRMMGERKTLVEEFNQHKINSQSLLIQLERKLKVEGELHCSELGRETSSMTGQLEAVQRVNDEREAALKRVKQSRNETTREAQRLETLCDTPQQRRLNKETAGAISSVSLYCSHDETEQISEKEKSRNETFPNHSLSSNEASSPPTNEVKLPTKKQQLKAVVCAVTRLSSSSSDESSLQSENSILKEVNEIRQDELPGRPEELKRSAIKPNTQPEKSKPNNSELSKIIMDEGKTCAKLSQENIALQEETASIAAENERLVNRLIEMEHSLYSVSSETDKIRNSLEGAEAYVELLKREREDLLEKMQQIETRRDATLAECESLMSDLQSSKVIVERRQEEWLVLRKEKDEVDSRVESLMEENEALKSQVSSLNDYHVNAQEEFQLWQRAKEELESEKAIIAEENRRIKLDKVAIEERLKEKHNVVNALELEKHELNSKLASILEENRLLRSSVVGFECQLQGMKCNLSTAQQTMVSTERAREQAELKIGELETQNNSLQFEVSSTKRKCAHEHEEFLRLKDSMDDMKKVISSLREEISSAAIARSQIELELKQWEDKCSSLQKQLSPLQDEKHRLELDNSSLFVEISNLKKSFENLESKQETTAMEREKIEEIVSTFEGDNLALAKKISSLQNDLTRIESSCEKLPSVDFKPAEVLHTSIEENFSELNEREVLVSKESSLLEEVPDQFPFMSVGPLDQNPKSPSLDTPRIPKRMEEQLCRAREAVKQTALLIKAQREHFSETMSENSSTITKSVSVSTGATASAEQIILTNLAPQQDFVITSANQAPRKFDIRSSEVCSEKKAQTYQLHAASQTERGSDRKSEVKRGDSDLHTLVINQDDSPSFVRARSMSPGGNSTSVASITRLDSANLRSQLEEQKVGMLMLETKFRERIQCMRREWEGERKTILGLIEGVPKSVLYQGDTHQISIPDNQFSNIDIGTDKSTSELLSLEHNGSTKGILTSEDSSEDTTYNIMSIDNSFLETEAFVMNILNNCSDEQT